MKRKVDENECTTLSTDDVRNDNWHTWSSGCVGGGNGSSSATARKV